MIVKARHFDDFDNWTPVRMEKDVAVLAVSWHYTNSNPGNHKLEWNSYSPNQSVLK